jgi:hypothetical protein
MVDRASRLFGALIAAFAFGAPASALAAPIAYSLSAGSLTITVDEYSPTDGRIHRFADPVKVDITSAVLTLDAEQGTVDELAIGASPNVELALHPDTPAYEYDGYRTLIIESLGVHALGGSLLASDTGFSFAGADLDLTFGATGTGGSYSGDLSTAGSLGPGPIFGDLANGGPVSLSGTAVGVFASPFNDSTLIVTGNFTLKAVSSAEPVPEPDALLLFLAGLTVAAASAGRSRTGRAAGHAPRL